MQRINRALTRERNYAITLSFFPPSFFSFKAKKTRFFFIPGKAISREGFSNQGQASFCRVVDQIKKFKRLVSTTPREIYTRIYNSIVYQKLPRNFSLSAIKALEEGRQMGCDFPNRYNSRLLRRLEDNFIVTGKRMKSGRREYNSAGNSPEHF